MAAGLPVILSDFSGYRDFISEGREGFHIPTIWTEGLPEFLRDNTGILEPSMARLYLSQMVAVDLEKLRVAILQLGRDASLRFRMGGAAKSRAYSYRWSNIIRLYENFWAKVKEESRRYGQKPLEPPDILVGDFSSTFSHYPSRRLSASHEVRLTDDGHQILGSPATLVRYDDVQVCIFPELSIDASRSVIPALQVILFVAATGRVLFSIVRSGVDLRKTVAGVAALVWAAGMLMITFVSAQCDLYGYCL